MKLQPCFFCLSVDPEEQVAHCTELQVLSWFILAPLGLVSAVCLQRDRGAPCPAHLSQPGLQEFQTVAEGRGPALGGGSAPVSAAVECGILSILWVSTLQICSGSSLKGLSFWVFYSDRCVGGSLGFRDTVVSKPYQGWHSKVVRKK